MAEWHALAAREVVSHLDTDARSGLSTAEAAARSSRTGPNLLPEPSSPNALALLGRQLRDGMVMLLLGAGAISIAIGEALDAGVILAIVVLNAVLGVVQEGRAEQAARAVRGLLAPRARVVRDGVVLGVPAAALTVGDVVLLGAGDRVPADGRLLEGVDAEVDQSALTGESLPVPKDGEPPCSPSAPLAERATMLYAGTAIVRGTARMAVTAVGPRTEVGRIVELAALPRVVTPLQQRLDGLARTLLRAASVACLGLAALAYAHGDSAGESVLIGVSLAVAAVPEGLAAVVTIALALGMRDLARLGAIVRRLRAVETLGSTSVSCVDKTGTLTRNEMSLVRAAPWPAGAGDAGRWALLSAAVLICDPVAPSAEEDAILAGAGAAGVSREGALASRRLAERRPFDAARKRSSVVVSSDDGARHGYVMGAPEMLLPRLVDSCAATALEGEVRTLTEEGNRVLMVAERRLSGETDDPERALRPLGLLALADPPRADVPASVARAQAAGVRVAMITGDHPRTAAAVARLCGLGTGEPVVLTGAEMEPLSDRDLARLADRVDVFARVVPEQKLRIVRALQARGHVVAMTGDGVNDVPALSAADVGIAMGRGGSDAAIDVADIVLTDNSFTTIVAAIEAGRTIYRNITRFIQFLLAANTGEVLVFALAIAPGLAAPLTVVQILIVNLLTDGLPAVALALDPPDEDVLMQPPRRRDERLLANLARRIALGGALTGAAAFAAFLYGRGANHASAQTMAFTTLVFAQLAYVFAIRGDRPFWHGGRNRVLIGAVGVSAAAMAAFLAVRPLSHAAGVSALSASQLAVALALSCVPFVGTELAKVARRS